MKCCGCESIAKISSQLCITCTITPTLTYVCLCWFVPPSLCSCSLACTFIEFQTPYFYIGGVLTIHVHNPQHLVSTHVMSPYWVHRIWYGFDTFIEPHRSPHCPVATIYNNNLLSHTKNRKMPFIHIVTGPTTSENKNTFTSLLISKTLLNTHKNDKTEVSFVYLWIWQRINDKKTTNN